MHAFRCPYHRITALNIYHKKTYTGGKKNGSGKAYCHQGQQEQA